MTNFKVSKVRATQQLVDAMFFVVLRLQPTADRENRRNGRKSRIGESTA